MARVEIVVLAVMLDGPDLVWVRVAVVFWVGRDGVVGPGAFP